MNKFNGLNMGLGNLSTLSNAKTRSISSENRSGGKGMGGMAPAAPDGPARDLGTGWKCHAWDAIKPGEIFELADIKGPGAIQSIWITGSICRDVILRIYWDNQDFPSVECPIGDFFASPWSDTNKPHTMPQFFPNVNSMPVAVNPRNGMNCFWEMPFRKHCRMTLENRNPKDDAHVYFQINYTLTDVPEDAAYFHAQFRRVNPLPYKEVYTILDGVKGHGHYVGTVMGWGINSSGWWGEGEIKFFIDGDKEFPTICGTGTEDYFGGSYNWDIGEYKTYSTPFMGMHQVIKPDGLYNSQHRHAMYRWHIMDPIRFEEDLKVTIQALGWRKEGRFLPGQHDICSTAFWYQTLPAAPFPKLPSRDYLEII